MGTGEGWGGHDEGAGGWEDPWQWWNEISCCRKEWIKKKRNAPKLLMERVPPCLEES